MSTPRSFVILYTGREGSSALIDVLGRHPAIYIAGFEHLDRENLRQRVRRPRRHVDEILERALTTGEVPGRSTNYAGEGVIGFKWRPFSEQAAAATFRRHQTRVVFLFRRNAVARALSATLRPDHVQFRIANMAGEERTAALAQLRAERFVADPRRVAQSVERYRKLKARHWSRFGRIGLEVRPLEYEWFLADPLAAVNALLSFLAVEAFEELPGGRFVTTFTDIEGQCDNVSTIRGDRSVRRALERYDALLSEIDGSTKPSPIRRSFFGR